MQEVTNPSPCTLPPSSTQHDQQHQQEEVPQQQLRRSGRPHKLNPKYANVGFFACEPQKFEEASKEEVWRKAMDEEIKMIKKNHTWELMQKLEDKEIIGLKWVYKIKYNEDGTIQKHKARLVAKGYSQLPGVDFNETFAPVVCMETIRTVLALAA
ncbi:uncharacterized mitochondrial protein AtMg00820-like [Glycine max]|uniref:uncharacterized mitochondrial protein AtMg00820-like n=1 Tax=Glycine max TaxID=3847 RepID=UPI0007192DEC|nr:uncharacterized mitochondrial protein AtMg00820-like [Glycine max]|eukprot:XP_014626912.1 uncharacterized protein LOC106797221 [Glycine max]